MKAAVRHEYGGPEVLNVEEVPTPDPRDDEVLIRIRAASVNLGDWELLSAEPRWIAVIAHLMAPKPLHPVASPPGRGGWFKPRHKILGCDVAGRVEAVGRNVTQFRPGDEVFGDCSIAGFGAFAEYVSVPEKAALVPKPAGMTFEQAAAIPQAAFIAVQGIRDKARVRAGHKVLVNGAGGGAGSFAVQVAKSYGAEVTGVDGPNKMDLMRAIGADHVVDYTRDDYTRGGRLYDAILDLAAHRSVFDSRRALAPGGIYILAGGSGKPTAQSFFLGPFISRTGRGRVAMLAVTWPRENLTFMVDLFEAGKFAPAIDRIYPLDETGEAIRRLGDKRSLGKVIVTP